MFLTDADFYQQQSMVMARMAQHEQRYAAPLDTTAVVSILTNLIPRTPRDSVVSDALLTALEAIEQDIDRHMKEAQQ